jgi:alginate production protein
LKICSHRSKACTEVAGRRWPVLALVLALAGTAAAQRAHERVDAGAQRQRLTERTDRLRSDNPLLLQVFDRPLALSAEVDAEFEWRRAPGLGARALRLELQGEAFYSLAATLAVFGQVRLGRAAERDPGAAPPGRASYVERGEAWLHASALAGAPLDLEVGRLRFEDERRFWWDDELDAVRLSAARGDLQIAAAAAREFGRRRSDEDGVVPQQHGVRRWFALAQWEPQPEQRIDLVVMRHDDRSAREQPGAIAATTARDEVDARLTWFGIGAASSRALPAGTTLELALDVARVRGTERAAVWREISAHDSRVESVAERKVRGWAFDVALRWSHEATWQPRLFAGYAAGSGAAAGTTDRSFRATGLQTHEADFGGVKHFSRYGTALDPQLANLAIASLGAGVSIHDAASLDLVWHRYRRRCAAAGIRAAEFADDLNTTDRAVGRGLDVVAAYEVENRLELVLIGASFRAGPAFGASAGRRFRRFVAAGAFAF